MLTINELPNLIIRNICLFMNVDDILIFLYLITRKTHCLNDASILSKLNTIYGDKRLKIWKFLLNVDENSSKLYQSNYIKIEFLNQILLLLFKNIK